MSNETQKNPEKPTFDKVSEAMDAVNREVLLSGVENYRNAVKVFGRRMVGDRELPLVDDQPTLHTAEISGGDIIQRLQQAPGLTEQQKAAAETLGIGADQKVTLAFATECFEQNPQGDFDFTPANAMVLVHSEYPNDNHETWAYSVQRNRLNEGQDEFTGTNYGRMYEMSNAPDPDEELPEITFDAADIALSRITNPEKAPTRIELDEAQQKQVGDFAAEGRGLSADEVQAMITIASHFSS